jgi:uncharacterized protein
MIVPAFLVLLLVLVSAPPTFAKVAGSLTVHTASGAHRFSIEWATTPSEREHGLMGRKKMPADHGMLFDFGTDQPVIFWMKDTPLSLDMVFIASDGTVQSVAERTEPFSLKMIPSRAPVRYVLEVNGGISERLGIVKGSKVDIEGQ